ncbi:MAG TPA: sphingosine kinase, partial [Cryptosporangiaceae bacterium]|nr:sphingosine kinase [Cryptosporangiaceae bacterium]
GNDFATALGIPLQLAPAVRALADDLRRGRSTPVDAARTTAANGDPLRWWVSVLASGFDSAVSERANLMRWPRGPRRYDVAIVRELLRLAPKAFELELDGDRWAGPATAVSVGNTSTYGGGMRVCPTADHTDGLFDVTVVGPISRTELVRFKPRLYAGTHVDHPGVHTHRAATVTLRAAGVAAYADGEPLGALPLTVDCVPGALRVAGIRPAA